MHVYILLMTYRRPENTKRILDIIKNFNKGNIFVFFNDGLKFLAHKDNHKKTRNVIFEF